MTKDYLSVQNPNRAANFIKSTLHKWFQLFERPLSEERVSLQMELLAEDVRIITPLGSIIGKSNFPEQLSIFNQWKLANHVSEIDIYPSGVRLYTASAKSSYHVVHPDGIEKNHSVMFEADIKMHDDLSCDFQRIMIKSIANKEEVFIDNYLQHRASDIIYYCMGIIEKNISDSNLFDKCFEYEFEINPLKNHAITSFAGISAWIIQLNKDWKDLSLKPVNISVRNNTDDEIHVKFDLLMEGINNKDLTLSSLSKNHWVLSNNINESFARIKRVHVEKLEPIFI